MASEVDIVNLALANLGDAAQVSSINPPDTSAQAGHCARFYPIARNSLMEMHPWGFCTKRVSLALSTNTSNQWQYVYVGPSDVANYLTITDPNAPDDFSGTLPLYGIVPLATNSQPGVYEPQPFVVETDSTGVDLVYTNQVNAVLKYSAIVTDTTTFSPLFVEALSFKLASMLAGPLIKGTEGRQVAGQMMGAFHQAFAKATESDANQRRTNIAQSVAWMVNR